MNEKAKKYVNMFRQVKIASAATIDEKGYPQSRIINIMIASDEGMYIVTSRGKPFYKQLTDTERIALSAMCPNCQSLKFSGKVKQVERKWVDCVFEQNPGMNEVYPGETRHALEAFLIYKGSGEWFDLLNYPINRESFAYNTEEEKSGFEITEYCTGCSMCQEVCPQKCITEGRHYWIAAEHCLQCGACAEVCPADAVRRIHA